MLKTNAKFKMQNAKLKGRFAPMIEHGKFSLKNKSILFLKFYTNFVIIEIKSSMKISI